MAWKKTQVCIPDKELISGDGDVLTGTPMLSKSRVKYVKSHAIEGLLSGKS